MKFYANGREVRRTIVQGTIENLFECVDALKNNGNEKYPPQQIAKIKSEWAGYRRFLNLPADLVLRGVESEFDLTFHSGIVEVVHGEKKRQNLHEKRNSSACRILTLSQIKISRNYSQEIFHFRERWNFVNFRFGLFYNFAFDSFVGFFARSFCFARFFIF